MQADRELYSMHGKVHIKNVSSHFLHTWTLDVLFVLFQFHLEASYVGLENEKCISVNNVFFLIVYFALLKGRFTNHCRYIDFRFCVSGFLFVCLFCCCCFFWSTECLKELLLSRTGWMQIVTSYSVVHLCIQDWMLIGYIKLYWDM